MNYLLSNPDIELTKKPSAGDRLLEIAVLDHIVLTGESYFSIDDEGLL